MILDETWAAEGGRPGREAAGFGAHAALARQPQFASLVSLDADSGSGSGSWLGNAGTRGVVLTSCHVFEHDDNPRDFVCRGIGGTRRRGTSLVRHPIYNWNNHETSGFDVAILYLDGPINDGGPPPVLYSGRGELGQELTMIGYGSRGIASIGEDSEYDTPNEAAAATNVIDEVMDANLPARAGVDSGNWLRVTMLREDEGAEPLDGVLGSGDSGGPAWMETPDGRWVVAGVNSNGGETYGEHSEFARVSGLRDWILKYAPMARFSS